MTLTFEDAQVQTIVNALAQRPYAEVFDVMASLQRQAMQQQQGKLQAVDPKPQPIEAAQG